MKKLLSLMLSAALLLALAACGKPATPIPNPPLVLGEKYLTDLDYEQALLQFDQAIVVDPKNPRGYLGKLITQERSGDLAGAKATVVSAKKQVKNFPALDLDAGPEAIYPAIVTWGRENKLESFVSWLLGLLAKWFPGESWVEDELEGLKSKPGKALNRASADVTAAPKTPAKSLAELAAQHNAIMEADNAKNSHLYKKEAKADGDKLIITQTFVVDVPTEVYSLAGYEALSNLVLQYKDAGYAINAIVVQIRDLNGNIVVSKEFR